MYIYTYILARKKKGAQTPSVFQEALVHVGVWCLGEFGDLLVSGTAVGPDDQPLAAVSSSGFTGDALGRWENFGETASNDMAMGQNLRLMGPQMLAYV